MMGSSEPRGADRTSEEPAVDRQFHTSHPGGIQDVVDGMSEAPRRRSKIDTLGAKVTDVSTTIVAGIIVATALVAIGAAVILGEGWLLYWLAPMVTAGTWNPLWAEGAALALVANASLGVILGVVSWRR